MKSREYRVYCLKCLPNGKLYFGITKRPISVRMKQHRQFANRGSNFLISRAIAKYGWDNFEVSIVGEGLSRDEACDMECSLIEKHRTCFELGYNMLSGGQHGISLRPETKARRSIAAKKSWEKNPKVRAVVSDPERNRKISERSRAMHREPEYREMFLKRHKEMVAASTTEESIAKRKETFRKNGNCTKVKCSNGMTFESVSDAADWISINSSRKAMSARPNILACARGRRRSAYGYKWSLGGADENC